MTLPEHHLVTPVSLSLLDGMDGEDVCALCAGRGTCCCATDPGWAHLSFPLSSAEWRRLLPFAHLVAQKEKRAGSAAEDREETAELIPPEKGDAVCLSEENSPAFLQAVKSLFPAEQKRLPALFPEGGRHLRLRTRSDGSCVFLSGRGCRLPREARPWYCLLFPGWVQGTSVTLFMSESCLAAQHAKNPAHGLKIMGMTRAGVFALYASLRRDWGL